MTAVLDPPDGAEIPAAHGKIVEFEDGMLEIQAPGMTLNVTATDAGGNSAVAEVEPAGLSGDNDDTLASAELDD